MTDPTNCPKKGEDALRIEEIYHRQSLRCGSRDSKKRKATCLLATQDPAETLGALGEEEGTTANIVQVGEVRIRLRLRARSAKRTG